MKKLNFLFLLTVFVFIIGCVPPPSDTMSGAPPQGDESNGAVYNENNSNNDNGVDSSVTVNSPETNKPVVSVKTSGQNGKGIDLLYKFTPQTVWKYSSVENTKMAISFGNTPGMDMGSMPGMGLVKSALNVKYKSSTDFSIAILSVNRDGSAEFEMRIDGFSMYMEPSNTLVASNKGLSLKDLRVTGNISRKGKVVFYDDLYMVITKNKERYLVSAKISGNKNSASAVAAANGTKVKVFARFDPKTGVVTGGAKVTVKKPAKTVSTLKIESNDTRMDILPKKFMELFRLPDGKIAIGSKTTIKAPFMALSTSMTKYSGSVASLTTKMSMSKNSGTASTTDMPDDAKASIPTVSGSGNVLFHNRAGRLLSINGTISYKINVGMKMEISSKLKLNIRQ